MMRRLIIKIEICAVLLVLFTAVPLKSQHRVKNSVLGSGGGAVTGRAVRITGTAGQVIIGKTEGSAYHSEAGFWHLSGTLVTAIEAGPSDRPSEFRLEQNFPNPFNPVTSISFSLPELLTVRLEVYNMLGEKVRTLITDDPYEAGRWAVLWDGQDDRGASLSSGIYIYLLTAGEYNKTLKMMMVK